MTDPVIDADTALRRAVDNLHAEYYGNPAGTGEQVLTALREAHAVVAEAVDEIQAESTREDMAWRFETALEALEFLTECGVDLDTTTVRYAGPEEGRGYMVVLRTHYS